MNNNFWLKLPYDILNDPVIGPMSDTDWRKYMELYIVAAKYGQNGVLPDIDALPYLLRTVTENVTNLLRSFEKRGLLLRTVTGTYQLTRYENEQSAIPAATRMQKMRENTKKPAKKTKITQKPVGNSVTNRNGKCYESQENYINNINNINKISNDDFENLWNILFTNNDAKLKNALQRDYKGADIIARMSQWAKAKERGLVDLNNKQLYRRIQWDNDAPQPDADIAQAVEQSSAFKSVEPTAEEAAIEIYRQMVASPLLKHRSMSVKNGFTPVSANGKLILEYVPGSVPEKFLEPLRKEFETACYDVAGIGVELIETIYNTTEEIA